MEKTFRFVRKTYRFECGCGAVHKMMLECLPEEVEPLKAEFQQRKKGSNPFIDLPNYFKASGANTNLQLFDYKDDITQFLEEIGEDKVVDIEITIRERGKERP